MGGNVPLRELWFGFAIFIKDDIELITNFAIGILGNCEKMFPEDVYGRTV